MRTTITHLPAQIQADLNVITEFLLDHTNEIDNRPKNAPCIRYLVLHGCFTEDHWQPNTALCPDKEDYRYNLLVVISRNLPEILPALQETVEQLNQSGKVSFPVSIDADTGGRLNQKLMDGYLTYDHVQTRGILIYRRGRAKSNPFSPPKQQRAAEYYTQAQEHFDHSFPLAKSFLSGARSFENKKPDAAAYLLNVAAVQAYATFMAVHTLKYSERRRIHELRALAESIHPDLKALWSSPHAQSCFDLLKTAFSGVRFGTDYSITGDQLEFMFSYVEDLHELIQHACEIKLEALKIGNLENPELSPPDSVEKKQEEFRKLSRLIFQMEEPCYELEGLVEVIRDMSHDGADDHPGIHVLSRVFGERVDGVRNSFNLMTDILRKRNIRKRRHATQEAANS